MNTTNVPGFDRNNLLQMQALDFIENTNSSFFLTGRAGTGKTTFLNNVREHVDKNFVVLASTGVAAILAGGDTIHSFFGLPLQACEPGIVGQMNRTKIATLKHADTVIIDEISMVRCDTLDAIDSTMRYYLRSNRPFGGKQMVFCGDMFQLEPVTRRGTGELELLKDIYGIDSGFYFYKAKAFKGHNLPTIELQKVYRQENPEFLAILQRVRTNTMTLGDVYTLNRRVLMPVEDEGHIITITGRNDTADKLNVEQLARIDTEEFHYGGKVEGKFAAARFPAEEDLALKVGAQVMFTRNDEADATYDAGAKFLSLKTLDCKTLYQAAILGELYDKGPGLAFLQNIIGVHPEYLRTYGTLRTLMKHKGIELKQALGDPLPLVAAFNGDANEEEFLGQLRSVKAESFDAFRAFVRIVKDMNF